VESGYARRRDVYNLYHLLNHLNLFGGSYLARTARTLARLVA
jgi:fructosamine-3-kinase